MSLSAKRETAHGAEKLDREGGQESTGLGFYVLNHVLYLIISPPIDNGPRGALEAKANQRQPLWRGLPLCEAILVANSAVVGS